MIQQYFWLDKLGRGPQNRGTEVAHCVQQRKSVTLLPTAKFQVKAGQVPDEMELRNVH